MHPLNPVRSSSFLASLCAGAVLAAQGPPANVGLQDEPDGSLVGIGPAYVIRFLDDRVQYTPVLGKAAQQALPFGYAATAVARGDGWQDVADAERQRDDRSVAYRRGPLVEHYELRTDGVKQSFVFHALPPGDGDLVVRGAVTTALAAPSGDAAAGLDFLQPDAGGVRLGAVIGIDARGARGAGTLRWDGQYLDFVLPAAFVARAALPLVVDPLIGTAVAMNTAAENDDRDPDLAWDDTNNVWLVVWTRSVSGADTDVVGQRVSANGTLVGGAIGIQVSSVAAGRPRVANLQASDRFVVVWEESGNVAARSVAAATGQMSSQMIVAPGHGPVVAGDPSTTHDDALVVWIRPGVFSAVDGIAIQATAGGSLTAVGAVTQLAAITTSFRSSRAVEISRSGGAPGRYAIVWQDSEHGAFGIPPVNVDYDRVQGLLVDRGLNTLATFLVAEDGFVGGVDGDGDQWVAAWSTSGDVLARSLRLGNGGSALSAPVAIADQSGSDERNPSVAWLGNSALVAWADDVTNSWQVMARSIDPFTCAACEGTTTVNALGNDPRPRVASRFASGDTGDDAAIAWSQLFLGDVQWQAWDAEDGAVTDLGGGCGNGGRCHAPCAHPGNQGFALRLRAAGPGAAAFALFGFQNLGASCGSCTLVPDAFAGFVQAAGNTSAAGDAAFVLPLPAAASLVGQSIFGQWVTAGTSCLGGLDFSNGIRITIE
jgi:hypothetical protein